MQSYLEIAKQALKQHRGQAAEGKPAGTNNEFNEFNEVVGKGPAGDGRPPPLDRPPETNQELRRLIDHLADTEKFTQWLERAMKYAGPSEASQ